MLRCLILLGCLAMVRLGVAEEAVTVPPVACAMPTVLVIDQVEMVPLLPFAETQRQVSQLQAAGLNVAWHAFPKEHTIYGAEEVDVIREFVRAGYAGAHK